MPRRHPTTCETGLADADDGVSVLERDEAGHHCAGEQRDLERAAGRIGPEQPDRQADEADEGDDRDDRVEQRGLADPGSLLVAGRDLVVH